MTDKRLIFYGPPGHLPRLHIFQWTLSIPYNFSDCHQILRLYLKYPVPLALVLAVRIYTLVQLLC